MSEVITIVGRLGSDPELRFNATGDAICNLRVVTSRRYKDNNGEWQERDTTWWSVTAWRQLAENVAESLHKGDEVIVRGDLRSREYETQQGEKRTAWEVDAKAVGPNLARAVAVAKKVQRETGGYGAGRQAYQSARNSENDDPWTTPAPADAIPF